MLNSLRGKKVGGRLARPSVLLEEECAFVDTAV